MNPVRISIVIPVYNVERYIERCLQSVINQTYSGPMECILVDDCGGDDSVEIAQRMISEYNGPIGFCIIHHKRNKGLSGARNTGTTAATGDYVYYIDSDDELCSETIQLLADEVAKHPGVDVVQGTTLTIPDDDPFYSVKRYAATPYVTDNAWIRREFYKTSNGLPVNAWNKLIRRHFITDNGLFFREGIIHEDQHWMYFAVQKIQSMAFVQETTYRHYRNDESIMKSTGNAKSNLHWGKIMLDIAADLHANYAAADHHLTHLALRKYEIILLSRYSDTDEYRTLYSQFLSLSSMVGDRVGVVLLKLWHAANNPLTRVVARQYFKHIN